METIDWRTAQDRPISPILDATSGLMECMDKKIWESECKRFGDPKVQYRKNMSNSYHLLWGQCTDAMQAKITEMPEFVKKKVKFDAIILLEGIRTSIHKFESIRYKYASLQ